MKKILFLLILIISLISSLSAIDYNNVELTKLTDKIWIHISYFDYNGVKTPSNGLVIDTDKGLVLIDTPWTNVQTENLIKLTGKKFNKKIILAIFTHYHQDRIGGIEILHKNKVETKSMELTAKLAVKAGYNKPEKQLNKDITMFNYKNIKFETFFPGAGHTIDNIVVWFPDDKILFGGCFIKSDDANNIGNTADADVKSWSISLANLKKMYPDIKVSIPGHGYWSSKDLIKHTIDLLNK